MRTIDSKILVEVTHEEAYTEKMGGFVVPSDDDSVEKAKVLSTGEKIDAVSLKPGDVIYIQRGSGYKFKNEGKEYRVISIPDVIVVLD